MVCLTRATTTTTRRSTAAAPLPSWVSQTFWAAGIKKWNFTTIIAWTIPNLCSLRGACGCGAVPCPVMRAPPYLGVVYRRKKRFDEWYTLYLSNALFNPGSWPWFRLLWLEVIAAMRLHTCSQQRLPPVPVAWTPPKKAAWLFIVNDGKTSCNPKK